MGERARILVVDDDESVRKVLKTILEKEGYRVDTAKNGKEAIKKSETKFYNLALIDIRFPDIKGTKLLTALKETTPKMVKIIVTGYPSLQNAVKAVNKGAGSYVVKLLNMDNLLNSNWLKRIKKNHRYCASKCEEKVIKYSEVKN